MLRTDGSCVEGAVMALIVHLGYGHGDSVDNVSKKSERYYPYRKPTQVIGREF